MNSNLLRQGVGYGLASAGALLVDLSTLYLLVEYCAFGYLTAATIAFLVGASVAYLLAIRLAFREHRLEDRRVEFAGFLAIGALGLAVNSLVIGAATRYLALHYLTAKCVAAGFTFSCNFVVRRQMLFVRRPAG